MTLMIFMLLLVPTLLFFIWITRKPTSLWTGFWFLCFFSILGIFIFFLIEKIAAPIAYFLGVIIALSLVFVALFGIYAMIIALFWNERILLKRERHSLSNMLPLGVATGLIVIEVLLFLSNNRVKNQSLLKIFSFINTSFVYFAITFVLFTLTAVLYNFYPIFGKVDYIIVLGAGLNRDKVTPLLASRIEAGIKLYNKQLKKYDHAPTLIMSGGQGSDELISEAQAMANYINEKGYQPKKVYLEDRSTTTRENILYSQELASKKDNIASFHSKKVVVATNNYHLLRAGILARNLGLSFRGIGAQTKFYYLPTAFIREYIGYLVMTKKRHLIVIGILFITTIIPILTTLFG